MKKLTQKIINSAKRNKEKNSQLDKNQQRLKEHFATENELADYLLDNIILNILTASSIGIDLLETLEDYYKGQHIRIWIPIMPPGINATYGVNCAGGKRKVYKTKDAKEWERAAIMPIRNAANLNGFLINKADKLGFSLLNKGSRHDIDSNIKMVLDTCARTLEFDDKIVHDLNLEIKRDSEDRGVLIEIEKLNE